MTKVVHLWATDGYISTPDGNSIYVWGFSKSPDSPCQLPGPTMVFDYNDEVIVNLHNRLQENVSIIFPGQENVEYQEADNTWHRVRPQFSGNTLTSLTNYAPPNGSITYRFTANNPGTFLYESGTNQHRQVHMGLFGAMVIRPDGFSDGNKTAYGDGTGTDFDREYLLVVNEIDPELHKAVEKGIPYDIKNYKPRYWTINGRCAPDTMIRDSVGFLPNQPKGSMIMMEQGEKILIRYIGAGIENHPLHLHGNHTRLVAQDGRILRNGTTDLSYKRFTVLVGAGQTCDMILEWTGLGFTPENPIPTLVPNLRNMAIGDAIWTLWSGSPYLGKKGDIPVNVVSMNQMGEFQFMLHSHEELQITNWGEFPGGMMSMLAVCPPGTLGPDIGVVRGELT